MEMYTKVWCQCEDIGLWMLKAVGCDIWNEYNLVQWKMYLKLALLL